MSPRPSIRTSIVRDPDDQKLPAFREEQGLATLVALVALGLFSVIALYMSFNATTQVKISDNYEAEVEATFAAKAGLSHAREVLKGLSWNDLLRGPDGTYTNTSTYLNQARAFSFRNPVGWTTARTLNVLDPTSDLSSLPDDGEISTGLLGTTPGTVIIPKVGIAFTAPNPYGSGTITTARYFVRVSDNNGEASELAKDAADNPFVDGDNIIIVRSMGIARTMSETVGGTVRRNSVAVVEARYVRSETFNLSCPLIIEGDNVNATFNGTPWGIQGGAGAPGVGTIDTNTGNAIHPDEIIKTAASAPGSGGTISGGGLPPPSVADVTAATASDPDKAKLMDPNYLYDFAFNQVPLMADYKYVGDQSWNGGSAPYLGAYDHTKPANDPSQDPKITWVNGSLDLSGNMTGGGLLVVTGDLKTNGRLTWDGLIIVIGNGYMDAGGLNQGVYGGVFVANLTGPVGAKTFGTPTFNMAGNSHIFYDSGALSMSVGLLAPEQLSYREITSAMDPP